jgi:hypothetical protein
MTPYRQIRADYNGDSIVVYQAYREEIARAALRAGRFVPPFSFNRMTWIKPSFLWLMERSGWGRKPGQECILAVRIKREGWDKALRLAVLTSFDPQVHASPNVWRERFQQAVVHVQWDPERSIHGKKLDYRSIQVGLSRQIIREYVDDWILDISDYTPLARKMRRLCEEGQHARAKKLLPPERIYEVEPEVAKALGMTAQ